MNVHDEHACPTYEEICTFCHEVAGTSTRFYDLGIATSPDDYILLQTEDFIVVPCIGALTDWYVLIVPRRHVLSAGWLTPAERVGLRTLSDEVIRRLVARTGTDVVLFEHGGYSFRDKGGACHDHSHIHAVATANPIGDFVRSVSQIVPLSPCDDWIEAASGLVHGQGRAYLALESSGGRMIAPARNTPSAFFRKALVSWLGGELGEDDWLVFPHTERLRTMISMRLAG